MDLRQITYFVALFEEGSVTRAARRVNIVQPALSMQIAKLERHLGQPLFDRTPRAMRPTAAARTLHRLVKPILRDLSAAHRHMVQLAQTDIRGRVTLGVLSSLVGSILPTVLARFAREHPDVELSVADGTSAAFIDMVVAGTLDLAIINHRPGSLGLVAHTLLNEEMVLVGASGAQLAPGQTVAARDLPAMKLALPSPRHGLRVELDRHLAACGLSLSPMLELDSTAGLAELVACSDWCSVLPDLAVARQLRSGALRAWRIVEPRIVRHLVAVYLPQHPVGAAGLRLLEVIQAALLAESGQLQTMIDGPHVEPDTADHHAIPDPARHAGSKIAGNTDDH